MRQILIISTVFFLPTILFGQTKTLNIPDRITKNKNWDYTIYEKQRSIDFNIKLLSLDTTVDHVYRLSDSRQIIEVWKKDAFYGGQIVNFTKTYVDYEDRDKKESELLYNKVTLPTDTAEIIFNRFKGLDSIPDMNKIKGWGVGFDGVTYSIESSTKETYSIKSYWTPTAQNDTVPHKKEINSFINFIYKDLNLYRHYQEFINTLPNGSYTDGFINMSIVGRKKIKKKK